MKVFVRCFLLVAVFPISGCVTMYTMVTPGVSMVDALQVTADTSWNVAPTRLSPNLRKGTQVWTKDGTLLDRLMIIPGIADGHPLLKDKTGTAALPLFRSNMLPNEIEELTETSMVKIFGEGEAAVTTMNLRPHRFGDDRGVLFDLDIKLSDSPAYKGLAGAFVSDGLLYLMVYIGAEPYYYDKHLTAATAVITSARLMSL